MLKFLLFAVIISQGDASINPFFMLHSESNCTENQFSCITDKKCIDKAKRCDGIYNCKDMSDEHDCEYVLCKDTMFFKCKNGRCISKSFVCDGQNDCEDFSDEEKCQDFKLNLNSNSSCDENEWRCSDRLCIFKDWVCNGEEDCLDGSDETIGCTLTITCDGFKCRNNHCIPSEWRCDGTDDCIDNSDEENCENFINPEKCTWENKKFLCSNNHTCIDIHQVCDGKHQCPDQSDESILCSAPTHSCSHHNCSHTCVQLPTGPKCYCPEGYHNINDKECQDINECEIYGICDQKCRNTPGSYECLCDHKYILQEDKKTCQAVGGEAMMVFSSKTQIRAYFLQSKIYFPVTSQMKQVVGVAYDGNYVYWTDIFSEHESIVKSLEDGTERQLVITAGLGSPEDLAVDTLTENIYFTDAEYKHIGVCTTDGLHCTVLVNKDIDRPRAIVLNIEEGEMFWSDWGYPARIARAYMDGSSDRSFVSDNIHWPNGLAIDYPNQRLYWTDAKAMTLESINLDGTDRRIVLEAVVKFPYAIAVFENRLYWSDWHTHSIQSCDKFTGKDHHTIIKEKKENIYGLSIYHSSQMPNRDNPCALAFCSDICLLKGSSYKCACPQNKMLSSDQHNCKEIENRQMLVLAAKNLLIQIEHQLLGKHTISPLPLVVKDVGALAYNPYNNSLYISDIGVKDIIELNMHTGIPEPLEMEDIGKITSMDFDYMGNNLYWGDEEKGTIEMMNMDNRARRVILHNIPDEVPESITLIPDMGIMFVSFRRSSDHTSHIDRILMDGSGRTHVMDHGVVGPMDLYYDRDSHRVFFADTGTGNIETTSVDGDDRHQFALLATNPVSLAALKADLFWVNEQSSNLYWSNKFNSSYSKKIILDFIPDNLNRMHLISVTPKTKTTEGGCSSNNGNCSHICITFRKSVACACPNEMELSSDQRTCSEVTYCKSSEFKCQRSNKCIPFSQRCNGEKDCKLGEDEEGCKPANHCPADYFMCDNGACIEEHKVCNLLFDCEDKSDEHRCNYMKGGTVCPPKHFKCPDDRCIAEKFLCDGNADCSDMSDELNCGSSTCDMNQFRCNSGACIPKSWECDREFDCSDMSDEHPQCESTCSPDLFTCNNGRCLKKDFVCDGADDCGDLSDEMNCRKNVHSRCGAHEFQCHVNSTACLPMSAVCNGTSECPGQDDELKCSNCQMDEFMCHNKKCIPRSWICDKTDDCGDGSDETKETCHEGKIVDHEYTLSAPCSEFRCKSGQCIDHSLVCNDNQDCYDGSDEGGACKSSCQANSDPCSQLCLKTPSGPTCRCREGYELMGDGKTCMDVDECRMEPPVCSQLCFNHPGSYQCDCYKDFELRLDKTSCKAIGDPMSMIYLSNNEIRQLTQKENSIKLLYSADTARITGLAYSFANSDIYVSIENMGIIMRINLKTGMKDVIYNVGQPKKVTLDWITNNIYFYNHMPYSKSIDVCNFQSKNCAPLIKTDLHSQVTNIAVDGVNRVLFYSVTTWFLFNTPTCTIYKVYLDGSGRQALAEDIQGYISGIAYDVNKKHLYYTNQHVGMINRVSYDGSMKVIITQNVTHSMGLGFFENRLYYLSFGGTMHKLKLFGGGNDETFKVNMFNDGLFNIVQKSVQPDGIDNCANNSCSYLCLPSKTHYRCLCEDSQVIKEGEKCHSISRSSADDSRPIRMRKDFHRSVQSSETSSAFIISLLLVIAILCIAAGGVYYMRRRKFKTKMNFGISFHNATYGLHDGNEVTAAVFKSGDNEYDNAINFDPTELQYSAENVIKKVAPLAPLIDA
uniref:Vitellogenin receptor n=2 Tax=Harmonia axyridis TaxID=115357 RepID=A0A8J9QZG0_HARAX|nr:vitellogenin receptor [Harmonia axyridis]